MFAAQQVFFTPISGAAVEGRHLRQRPGRDRLRPPINRYSPGTKNKDLRLRPDGSLTLHVHATRPSASDANWPPAPAGEPFSLHLRAYWPEDTILAPFPRR
ncbi:hypothetical protein Misp01_66800 [Microtetraspora sp. NBRC 13810]|uniref:DUF1214 domain-containing protein n=1 Tax=Microtetraspora sp. NBRC 13810 TaxID=3030990 RepID=UPI0024A25B50|nr:DUF1214 domain-containing protein [Microtetraspora sp. NBRC 13810]GLW11552.1 hypothetical protein Misp01_66800 [Microtetraspora sp. NBRC 13810]